MSTNQFKAYFTLVGDFDPSVITHQIKLEPSECWKKGDSNTVAGTPYSFSRWSLDSHLEMDKNINEHAEDVLDQLEPYRDAVFQLRLAYDGWLQTVVHLYSDSGSFGLNEKVIARCAALNLSIDVDYVYFGKDE